MIEIRDCVRDLLNFQLENASDEIISETQAKLNTLYDNFTARRGLINSKANRDVFKRDSSYPLLCSLEILESERVLEEEDSEVLEDSEDLEDSENEQSEVSEDSESQYNEKSGETGKAGNNQKKGKAKGKKSEKKEQLKLKAKSSIFTERTIRPRIPVTYTDNSVDALIISISEKTRVDLKYMTELTGFEESKIEEDLKGIVFRDLKEGIPIDQTPLVTADEYLSGNVRQKLATAKSFYERWTQDQSQNQDQDRHESRSQDPNQSQNDHESQVRLESAQRIIPNIESLQAVQPVELEASEIAVRLGATWIDPSYYHEFVQEVLRPTSLSQRKLRIQYSKHTGEWKIEGKNSPSGLDMLALHTYGTKRMNGYEILETTLNLRQIRINDYQPDPNNPRKKIAVLNKKETLLAQAKQEMLKEAFKEWIFKDPVRRETLVRLYNEKFNSTRLREFNGDHLQFPGMNPEITLHPHQKNAIARGLYGGNTLFAHEVGSGKTFEMIGVIMEGKRLGLHSKSLLAVPKHLTEQVGRDFLKLYPGANILVATEKDFKPENRKKFCARIATGNYDCVIIGHTQLNKIPMSKERQLEVLKQEIKDIEESIMESKRSRSSGDFSVKQMERTKRRLEAKMTKLTNSKTKDDTLTFEELGIDKLVIDEADIFKSLFIYSKMQNVAGISQTFSERAMDLYLKCRYMDEVTGSKGIIFATGTPISNSVSELYVMQKYLQYDRLEEAGFSHFDSWAANFGETQIVLELPPEGGNRYRLKTRFNRFTNIPELITLFKEVADIKTIDQMPEIERPEPIFKNIIAKPSEIQLGMIKTLGERAQAIRDRKMTDMRKDNMLKITGEGRKIGLDQRLINDLLPDEPGSKVNLCVDHIFNIWDETAKDPPEKRLTQILFCDLSTPKKEKDGEETFNVYDDIREKLIVKGIPRKEIVFVHEANTPAKKQALFNKVNEGTVRILLGSTEKMGAGTNVQKKLIALHDLDCPWRPRDLEQRLGRIRRQGNENDEIYVFRYATENTFDAYMWQLVENKQKFISQIMTSRNPMRHYEDVDETALSFARMKALCSGSPLISEKTDLETEIMKLTLLKSNHQAEQHKMQHGIETEFPKQISETETLIEKYGRDLKRLQASTAVTTYTAAGETKGIPPITIGSETYTKRKDAGEAIIEICGKVNKIDTMRATKIGEFRGFDMMLRFGGNKFELILKGDLSYKAELGTDAVGNITRINNAAESIPERLNEAQQKLESLKSQLENAKQEIGKPFSRETELTEKTQRLAQIDAVLDFNKDENLNVNVDIQALEMEEEAREEEELEKAEEKEKELKNPKPSEAPKQKPQKPKGGMSF